MSNAIVDMSRATMTLKKVTIVVDTREQNPLDFSRFDDVGVKTSTLWPGDYSIQTIGARLFAVERKSVSDLVGTFCKGYAGWEATTPKRFDCELLALSGIIHLGGIAFVLVEPDVWFKGAAKEEIAKHEYRSELSPDRLNAFIDSMRHNWRVPVIFADSRTHAAEIVREAALLAQSMKSVRQRVKEFNEEMAKEARK